VITTYSLVTLAPRLRMLCCLHAFLPLLAVLMRGLCGIKKQAVHEVLAFFPFGTNKMLKGVGTSDKKQGSDSKTVVELTNGSSEDVKELVNSDAPENNPQYTTVFVGNLAPEVTQLELHRHFYSLGAGVIEEV
nr:nucleotide-binding, alpha-beta plait [Tanacetum cinerariifolium]